MNCSGKHAAMLATCVVNGWPTETYLDPDHPLQQAIAATFAELTGEPVAVTARRRLRRAAALDLADRPGPRLRRALGVTAQPTARSARVADAIRAHPAYVSGTTRDELTLLPAVPGAIGKAGAESCYAVALPDGRAFALKIDDGAPRARPVVMAEALPAPRGARRSPASTPTPYAVPAASPLLGGGRPVGEIRAVVRDREALAGRRCRGAARRAARRSAVAGRRLAVSTQEGKRCHGRRSRTTAGSSQSGGMAQGVSLRARRERA